MFFDGVAKKKLGLNPDIECNVDGEFTYTTKVPIQTCGSNGDRIGKLIHVMGIQ